MFHYSNLSYFFRPKRLSLLPDYFRNYIFNNRRQSDSFQAACEYRSNLMKDTTILDGKRRNIAEITSIETMRPVLGGVVQKIIQTFKVETVLELGTSVGVGTMFLASSINGSVTTIDCNKPVLDFAQKKIYQAGVGNVFFVCDKIDSFLSRNTEKFDLIYIDGDHTADSMRRQYEYLLKSVNERYIIIFDDINYSKEMSDAWKFISKTSADSLVLNLFRWGMIFHGYDLPHNDICAWIKF